MKDIFDVKKLGIFAGGLLFGTAGLKILSSKDAKKTIPIVRQPFFWAKGLCYEDSNNSSGECRRHSF